MAITILPVSSSITALILVVFQIFPVHDCIDKIDYQGQPASDCPEEGQINNREGVLQNCQGQSELMLERK